MYLGVWEEKHKKVNSLIGPVCCQWSGPLHKFAVWFLNCSIMGLCSVVSDVCVRGHSVSRRVCTFAPAYTFAGPCACLFLMHVTLHIRVYVYESVSSPACLRVCANVCVFSHQCLEMGFRLQLGAITSPPHVKRKPLIAVNILKE